jgi:hypothetical protein
MTPEWTTAIVTGVLAAITAYYAWQNKRMADQLGEQREEMRKQLTEMRLQRQLGLYEPRANVLRAVKRALGDVATDGHVPAGTMPNLIQARSEKEFLFKKDMCDYLDSIYMKCLKAFTLHGQLEGVPVGPERTRLVNDEAELIGWILEQPTELGQRFKPYLQLRDFPQEGERVMTQDDPQVLSAEARTRQRDQAASELVRGLLIINGGGAAALLAFLGAIWSSPTSVALAKPTIIALWILASGAFAAGAFHLFRYGASVLQQRGNKIWRVFMVLYLGSAVVSLVCFIGGVSVLACSALKALP